MGKCSYCGKQESDSSITWCSECGSEVFVADYDWNPDNNSSAEKRNGRVFALATCAVVMLVAFLLVSGLVLYMVRDTLSIPIWLADPVVKTAVRRVATDKKEIVTLVNYDAFDYEFINILTSTRVLSLEDSTSEILLHDIPLTSISDAYLDIKDNRYLIIETEGGTNHAIFFVGSPDGFLRALRSAIEE